jgi:hypothetical protein
MMRLRQIALVASRLAPVVDDITHILGIEVCFNDPAVAKYGLENAVMPIGDTFLEVVVPVQEGTTAGRLLEKRGGDGGYMVILQVDDIVAARARPASLGVRVVAQYDRDDGVYMTHLHPRDVGGAILSIDAMTPPERWEWGGPRWRDHVVSTDAVAITGVDVQADAPVTMAARWADVLGRPASPDGDSIAMPLDHDSLIRFTPTRDDRGDGVGAFEVAVRDIEAVRRRAQARGCIDAQGHLVLCGTRVQLRQA